jgi:PAS domain S-box-containing protein
MSKSTISVAENAAPPSSPNSDHVVQFYDKDSFLVETVSAFIGSALAAGDAAVMIATEAHRRAVAAVLNSRGLDVSRAARQHRLISLDATETLAKFMIEGLPDAQLFREVIRGPLSEAAASVAPEHRRVAAFGEMVNVLWSTGNFEGALRLEQLWNRLAEEHSFSLLCAYPIAGFNSLRHSDSFRQICDEHAAVFPAESFPAATREEEKLRSVAHLQHQFLAMQSEAALLHSEQRFRLFVEAVRDYALFMLDTEGNITTWNTGAERIKGYKPCEIIGQHFSKFYPEEDVRSRKPWRALETATREGRFEDEGWRVKKDGSRFWAGVVITPIRDESGKLAGFSKVTRDLTEKRRSLEELKQAYSRLEQEVIERRAAEQRLQKSEKALRRLSLHLLRTQDDERKRIGRDLHDSLGQYLAMLKINLDSLRLSVAANDSQSASKIDQCTQLCRDALREVRTLSYLLYPPMLEEIGLTSTIPWYLEGFSSRSGIVTKLEMQHDFGRLALSSELVLFRALQESLTNVHRHSGSQIAYIRLFEENGCAVLEVEDEGSGFSQEILEQADESSAFGVGLRGMSERLRELGGKLELTSGKKGAIVRAVVPRFAQRSDSENSQACAAKSKRNNAA